MTTTTRKAVTAVIAAALIAGPIIGVASAASAHDQALSVTCTQISLNLSNYPSGSTVGGVIDGVDLGTSTFGPSFSQSAPLDPAVPHTYTITVKSGDGDTRYDKTFTGKSDPACIPVVTPPPVEPPVVTPPVTPPVEEPPVVTPPPAPVFYVQPFIDCLGGRFVFDNIGNTVAGTFIAQGVTYVVPAGTALHSDADGTLLQPLDGIYTITAGETTWTFPSSGNCPTTPPTEEPTTPPVTTPPTDVPVPSDEPTVPVTVPTPPVTPTGSPSDTTGSSPVPSVSTPLVVTGDARTVAGTDSTPEPDASALAFTGARDLTAWIAAAAALIAAGFAAIVVPILRRRKQAE
jgi:hypothetical protein